LLQNANNSYISYSEPNYTTAKTGTPVYFYKETEITEEKTETVTTTIPYNPVVSLKKGGSDVNCFL
jgi:hypothetical protein